jgi:hypothetical protein
MGPGRLFGLSAIEKNEIWRRWKAGQTLHEIGRAFVKPHSSIRLLLPPVEGFLLSAPTLPASPHTGRARVSRGMASGSSIREIARRLDLNAATCEMCAS